MSTKYIIGRKGDILLNDNSVSRHHAELLVWHNDIRLTDLNSTNGVFLVKNNRLIQFYDGFVQLNQQIVIGAKKYTINQLINMVTQQAA